MEDVLAAGAALLATAGSFKKCEVSQQQVELCSGRVAQTDLDSYGVLHSTLVGSILLGHMGYKLNQERPPVCASGVTQDDRFSWDSTNHACVCSTSSDLCAVVPLLSNKIRKLCAFYLLSCRY